MLLRYNWVSSAPSPCPDSTTEDLTPETHTSSEYTIQRNERNENATTHAQPGRGAALAWQSWRSARRVG